MVIEQSMKVELAEFETVVEKGTSNGCVDGGDHVM